MQQQAAQRFAYQVIEATDHSKLAERINDAARDGWEAINAYTASGSTISGAHHHALLRRPYSN